MSRIIKNRQIVDDTWNVLKLVEGETPESVALPSDNPIVPLAVWLARRDELLARQRPVGVWLDSHEGPEAIADDIERYAQLVKDARIRPE